MSTRLLWDVYYRGPSKSSPLLRYHLLQIPQKTSRPKNSSRPLHNSMSVPHHPPFFHCVSFGLINSSQSSMFSSLNVGADFSRQASFDNSLHPSYKTEILRNNRRNNLLSPRSLS